MLALTIETGTGSRIARARARARENVRGGIAAIRTAQPAPRKNHVFGP